MPTLVSSAKVSASLSLFFIVSLVAFDQPAQKYSSLAYYPSQTVRVMIF